MLRQCSSVNEILEEIRCSFKKEREEKEMKKGLKRLFGGLMAIVMVLSLVMISPGAEKNLVKIVGKELIGLAVVKPGYFAKVTIGA